MIRTIFSHINKKLTNSQLYTPNKFDLKRKKDEQEKRKDIVVEDQVSQNKQNDDLFIPGNECIEANGIITYAESMSGNNKNQLFTIKLIDNSECTALVKEISWNPQVGDHVKIIATKKLDENDQELEIHKIYPQKKEIDINRVTALSEKYAVFDDNKILFYATIQKVPHLKIYDGYKIEYVVSDQDNGLNSFNCRVTELLEKVDNRHIGNGIIFENKPFKIYLNQGDEHKKEFGPKHIKIFNRSDKVMIIKSMKIIPFNEDDSSVISSQNMSKLGFKMRPNTGSYKAFFNILPAKIGKFYFFLIVHFADFDEKYEFSIEIRKSYIVPGEKLLKPPRFKEISISEHGIPNDLREVDYNQLSSAKDELESMYTCLKEELIPINYLERMKLGLFLEEIAMEKAFESYHINDGTFETKGEYLKLTVKEVAERRPSIITGDKVIATEISDDNAQEKPIYEGYIHKVGDDAVFCKFHTDFHEMHVDKKFSIDFVFSRSLFRRLHHAVETFTSNGYLGYKFLFPKNKICKKNVQLEAEITSNGELIIEKQQQNWFNNNLNEQQKSAVVNVLRGENRPLPYIFFGCPGGGKTHTVVETILQIYTHIKSSKMIICTPSNSAANLIAEMLINSESFNENDPMFLRIISNNQVEKELVPDNLIKYCGTVNIAPENLVSSNSQAEKNEKGMIQNCTKSKIMEYKMIIGTLNGIGSLMLMSFDNYFTHVIVDEAGQCIEPELIIPLTMMSTKDSQCVLSGDPKQLGPIIISRLSSSFKFNISIIERLLTTHPYYALDYGPNKNEYNPKFVTKLKINYRSHPTVMKLYNDVFYNGDLECALDDPNSLESLFLASIDGKFWKNINYNCGVIFVNVANGKNKKVPESCSWYNEQEMNGVMKFIQKCQENNIPFSKIGILAPYALQVKKLKNQIAALNDVDLKVGTVEEFQGQERPVMVVSTVRTEAKYMKTDQRFGIGFLQCPKRINVAVSRARALLVIFGKESILQKDSTWKQIIEYAKSNNTFVNETY